MATTAARHAAAGTAVLRHGAAAAADRLVELNIGDVIVSPRLPLVCILARVMTHGVGLLHAMQQIVNGLYRAALDHKHREANNEDMIAIIFKHADMRNEFINTGFHPITTAADAMTEHMQRIEDKYEEIKFTEVTEIEGQVILAGDDGPRAVAGVTRKRKTDAWHLLPTF